MSGHRVINHFNIKMFINDVWPKETNSTVYALYESHTQTNSTDAISPQAFSLSFRHLLRTGALSKNLCQHRTCCSRAEMFSSVLLEEDRKRESLSTGNRRRIFLREVVSVWLVKDKLPGLIYCLFHEYIINVKTHFKMCEEQKPS